MKEITPLLEQYNGLVNVIMNTDYSVKEYQATEKQLASTLKQMKGKLSREHLHNITRITQVLNSETVMVPMAETVSSIESQESFEYLLNQFLECFEDGRNESATAEACYQAMLKLDPQRVQREAIDQHPFFM
ncbi:hypothetical protein [Leucothrix pacifica]|uniref:Uncharacterized protein n=1 Tax=Leucothrix pacifica TaxID=1247513 RepID=A0A317C853_9GAMM|nr:hypothetical protein [Leucothrix pacifica]PWQ92490.1 hypothetical protein DKW60_21080 [Leucothrix pacifica]